MLGVSGSIAAYKALTLAGHLTERQAEVDVVLTRAASELVRPLAFQAMTHRPVATDLFDPASNLGMDHLALALAADIMVVAPTTADVIAKLALGLADDALTTTALATRAPLVIAPAMEPNMWRHPATQANIATLAGRGAAIVGPVAGRLASGAMGEGRLMEPDAIADYVAWVLGRGGPLAGRHVVVTAGPTREPLDPVRYLSNHSSGRMGYAVAIAARDLGADVTLISGPVALAAPLGMRIEPVETAAEMLSAVLKRLQADPSFDALVMTAAVADYRPLVVSDRKLKKAHAFGGTTGSMPDLSFTLELAQNQDILAEVNRIVLPWPAEDGPFGSASLPRPKTWSAMPP